MIKLYHPYQGTVDPRLDWTVGRRGVPYLRLGNQYLDPIIQSIITTG